MKWVTFDDGGRPQPGLVIGDAVHVPAFDAQMVGLLGDDGLKLRHAAGQARTNPARVLPLASLRLLAPLKPTSIRDFVGYLQHLRNGRGVETLPDIWHEVPAFYFSNTAAVVGPNDPVPIAPGCQAFDFELEVAAIIGREGSNIDPDSAMDHVAGYMIMCDWSARDIQERDMKLGMGPAKSKDTATTFGPFFVTADELAPYASGPSLHLEMSAYVNNEYVGGGFMDEMSWSLDDMVAYASRGTTLKPGDVLGCGTVATGCLKELFARDSPIGKFRGWLKPGDVVRLEVEHLGATEQEIIEAPPYPRLRNGS